MILDRDVRPFPGQLAGASLKPSSLGPGLSGALTLSPANSPGPH